MALVFNDNKAARISTASWDGTHITYTTNNPHTFASGETVTVDNGSAPNYDGTFTIDTITSNGFNRSDAVGDPGVYTGTGKAHRDILTSGTTVTADYSPAVGGTASIQMFIHETSSSLTISGGAITAGGSEFKIRTPPYSAITTSNNNKKIVVITFKPSTTGLRTGTFTITLGGTLYTVTLNGTGASSNALGITVVNGATPGYGTPSNRVAPCVICAHIDPATTSLPAKYTDCYIRWTVGSPNGETYSVSDPRPISGDARDVFEHLHGASIAIPVKEGEDGPWTIDADCFIPGDVDGVPSISASQESITVLPLLTNRTPIYVTISGSGAQDGSVGAPYAYSKMVTELPSNNDRHYILNQTGNYDLSDNDLDFGNVENVSVVAGAAISPAIRRTFSATKGNTVTMGSAKGIWLQDLAIDPGMRAPDESGTAFDGMTLTNTREVGLHNVAFGGDGTVSNISNMTWSGGTMTVTTSANHKLTTGNVIGIKNVTPAAFDDPNAPNATVTVSSPTIFTYSVSDPGDTYSTGGEVYGIQVGNCFDDGITLGQDAGYPTPMYQWPYGVGMFDCTFQETQSYGIHIGGTCVVMIGCSMRGSVIQTAIRFLTEPATPTGVHTSPFQDIGSWFYSATLCSINQEDIHQSKTNWRFMGAMYNSLHQCYSRAKTNVANGDTGSNLNNMLCHETVYEHCYFDQPPSNIGEQLNFTSGTTWVRFSGNIVHGNDSDPGYLSRFRETSHIINNVFMNDSATGSLLQSSDTGEVNGFYSTDKDDLFSGEFKNNIMIDGTSTSDWLDDSNVSTQQPFRAADCFSENTFPLTNNQNYKVNGVSYPTPAALTTAGYLGNVELDVTLDVDGRPEQDVSTGRSSRYYFDYYLKSLGATDNWNGTVQSDAADPPDPPGPGPTFMFLIP